MAKDSIKAEFKYEDLLGNVTESKVSRTEFEEFYSEFDILVDSFKTFLLTCSFTEELINTRIK